MTEANLPRPTSRVAPDAGEGRPGDAGDPVAPGTPAGYDDLPDRPVAEHVEVFEAEHARLKTALGTIDRL